MLGCAFFTAKLNLAIILVPKYSLGTRGKFLNLVAQASANPIVCGKVFAMRKAVKICLNLGINNS